MKELKMNECPALKSLMIELTSYCPDCGTKREAILYNELPDEPKSIFKAYRKTARFLFCGFCKTHSIMIDD